MEMGSDHSAKKPRLEQLPSGPLNQEIVVHEPAGGGVAAVAAEHVPTKRAEVGMKIDVTVLQCPLCLRPLKPPVFQCKGGHLACAGCLDGACVKCGAAFDVPNTAMDAVVAVARVQCPHDGCETYVPYHEVQEHESVCPHAPCHCTEPGCGFAGATPELVAHLAAAHAMPVLKVPRFKATRIQVTVPEPVRRLLVCAEDEGGAFLLTLGALGDATLVSAVCVRPAGCEWPRYKVKMWSSNGPAPVALAADRRMDIVLADFEATSSATPGAITFDKLTSYLIVPPGYLVGDGPSKELPLQIRIEKTTS
ncbi:E3 ubiquitin-protein ligase SINA-like 10 [Lolium perenne]|uniref:E3 ubiquitin-protein ligase SINA-like 10 n=1 Tax=Lolium perenne TaxID=4522 RepID=UPI0021F5B519|nr:E3 ubiquitin-protein ligase SINA-like 10 [Lolium perenne]